jgi:hypothetical protein
MFRARINAVLIDVGLPGGAVFYHTSDFQNYPGFCLTPQTRIHAFSHYMSGAKPSSVETKIQGLQLTSQRSIWKNKENCH